MVAGTNLIFLGQSAEIPNISAHKTRHLKVVQYDSAFSAISLILWLVLDQTHY